MSSVRVEVSAGDLGTQMCVHSSFVLAVEVGDLVKKLVTEELHVDGVHSQVSVVGDGVFGGGQNRFSGDWSEFEDCL